MKLQKFLRDLSVVGVLCFLTMPVFFQNCAPINFTQDGRKTSKQSVRSSEQQTNSINGPTNGDGYEGKLTQYFQWSLPDECGTSGIVAKGEIQRIDDLYELVKRDCKEVPAEILDSGQIEHIAGGLTYQETEFLLQFPSSCQEIYNGGGENPNGYYWLDLDGQDSQSPELVYCDLTFISAGFSPWSDWTDCSAACGVGTQKRDRTCKAASCVGKDEQIRDCTVSCP